ncbi:MAG: hypothetical protein AAF750_00165 [Planctomycetota bacterium]
MLWCLVVCVGQPVAGKLVDEMESTDRFVAGTGVTAVSVEDGVVTVRKIEDGDAFARWGKPGGGMIRMTDDTDVLEIAFAEYPGGGAAQLRVEFLDGQGQWAGSALWKKAVRKPGLVVLPSVRGFAEEHTIEGAAFFQVFFRVVGGSGSGFALQQIRVADKLSQEAEKASEQARLDALEVYVDTGLPLAVIDAASDRREAELVIRNPSDTPAELSADWQIKAFAGDGVEDIERALPQQVSVPAQGEARFRLPAERFGIDAWRVDYQLRQGAHERSGAARFVVMRVHDRELPEVGGFHYAVAAGGLTRPGVDEGLAEALTWGVKAMGATQVRADWHWGAVQPSPETWRFDHLDRYIDRLERHGLEAQVLLSYNNIWAATDAQRATGNMHDWLFAPPDLELWETYVAKLAERYADDVRFWEVWNEPDLWNFWKGDTQQYIDLLRLSHRVIHELDPDAEVMTAGFALVTPHGGRVHFDLQRDVLMQAYDSFEIHAFHQHGRFGPFYQAVTGPLAEMRGRMPEQRPLFFNETAISAGSGSVADERLQAEAVIKKLTLTRSVGAMGHTWYNLFGSGSHNWGLIMSDRSPRPAYAAFATAVEVLGDLPPRGELDLGEGNYGFAFGDDQRRVLVYWNNEDDADCGLWTARVTEGQAEHVAVTGGRRAADRFGDRVLLQLDRSPEVLEVKGGSGLDLDEPLLRVEGPITLYPGTATPITMRLSNPWPEAIELELGLGEVSRRVRLEAGQREQLVLSLATGAVELAGFGVVHETPLVVKIEPMGVRRTLMLPTVAGSWVPKGEPAERRPDFVLNNRPQVQNLFDFDPASQPLVWDGRTDLSAKAWLVAEDEDLKLVVEVRDDRHVEPTDARRLWEGDSVQLVIQTHPERVSSRWHAAVATLKGSVNTHMLGQPENSRAGWLRDAVVIRDGTITRYEVQLDRRIMNLRGTRLRDGIGFNLVINDNDTDRREGWAEIAPGIARPDTTQPLPKVRFEF